MNSAMRVLVLVNAAVTAYIVYAVFELHKLGLSLGNSLDFMAQVVSYVLSVEVIPFKSYF